MFVLHRYAYWPYGTFKKMGIPGPKPVPFFGTMLAYRKVGEHNFSDSMFDIYTDMYRLNKVNSGAMEHLIKTKH